LVEDRRRLERQLVEAKKALALSPKGGVNIAVPRYTFRLRAHEPAVSAGEEMTFHFDPHRVEGIAAKDLKALADEAKRKIGTGVVAFVTVDEGRASLVVGVTDDLTERVNAVELARIGAEALGGKGGGGRPDMAQAGGPEGTRAQEALDAIQKKLATVAVLVAA
jgi:alanyl-tRNA synthetase